MAAVAQHVRAVVMSQMPPIPMLTEPAVVERGNRHREAIFCAFVKSMRAGRQQVDKDFFRNAAIERAATGFPLETALHIYRLCGHELWRWLVREVRRIGGGEAAVIELTDGWFRFLNAGSAALTEGYVRFEADRIADRDRTLREIIDGLIGGRVGGREALQARARSLGLDPTAGIRLLVAQPGLAGQGDHPPRLAATRELLRDTLRASAGEVAVVVRGTRSDCGSSGGDRNRRWDTRGLVAGVENRSKCDRDPGRSEYAL